MQLEAEYVEHTPSVSFTIQVSEFKRVLQFITSSISSNAHLAQSSLVKVEAVPASSDSVQHLRLTGVDGTQTLEAVTDTLESVAFYGAFVAEHRRLAEALSQCRAPEVEISYSSSRVYVRSGHARWTFTAPSQDFDIEGMRQYDGDVVAVRRDALISAIKAVVPAVPTDKVRPALAQIEVRDGAISACDGAKLIRRTVQGMPSGFSARWHMQFIKSLLVLLKIDSSDEVLLGAADGGIYAAVGGVSSTSREVGREYPDVDALARRAALTNDAVLEVSKEDLLEALDQASIVVDRMTGLIQLNLVRSDNSWLLRVSCSDSSGAVAEMQMPCLWSRNKAFEVMKFTHKHLTAALKAVPHAMLSIQIGEDTKTKKHPLYIEDASSVIVVQQASD